MKSEAENFIEVLITYALADHLLQELHSVSKRLRINVLPARSANEISDEIWRKTEILITEKILPPPEKAPNLKWIQFNYAGIDFAFDEPVMEKAGLLVTTLSGAAAPQMAEFVLMAMLSLSHKLPALLHNQRFHEWPPDRFTRLAPKELRDSIVGLIGYGSIAREVARILQPLGVTILAVKQHVMEPEDHGYVMEGMGDPSGDLFTRLYPMQAIRSAVKECDFVVISLPKTKQTQHLIDEDVLAAMKPSAYLIDVSRGGIVKPQALKSALQEKKIAGAFLDVFDQEPLAKDSPVWDFPNLIISPHIAGVSVKYNERAVKLIKENLKRYCENSTLLNLFDHEKGY